jgi:hypothetical protein
MHRSLARLFLVLPVLAAVGAGGLIGPSLAARAQAPTYVAGTGVGLVPPKGMTPAKGFSGFEDSGTGASILVAEFPPEAYAQLVTTFTPEGLAASGVQASGAAVDWKVQGGQAGRLVRGKQTAHGTVFRKWLLLAKGPSSTVMLSVQVPDAKSASFPDATVETALKTVALKAPPGLEEKAAALPFRIGDRAGFRPVRVLAGSGLMLTEGPSDVVTDASQPVVIVASALGAAGAQDKASREALAQQAFASIAGVSDVTIVSQTMEEKDGVGWSRIEGRGTYRSSMEAVSTLQHVRFEKGGYVRVVAIARSLDKDKLLPRVDALAASVTPK